MKRLICLLTLLLPFLAKAQEPQPVYGDYMYPGNILFDGGLYIPVRDTTGFLPNRVGALVILPADTIGHSANPPVRVWNGVSWSTITGGSGGVYFGNNGIHLAGNTFQLGDSLNQNTDIKTKGYVFSLNSGVKAGSVFRLADADQRIGFTELDSSFSGYVYTPNGKQGEFTFYAKGIPVGVLRQAFFSVSDSSGNSILSAGKDFFNLTGSTGSGYAQITPGNVSFNTASGTAYAVLNPSFVQLSSLVNTDTTKYISSDGTGKLVLRSPQAISAIDSALMDFASGNLFFRYKNGSYFPVFIGNPVDSVFRSNDTLQFRKTSGQVIAVKMTGIPQGNITGLADSLLNKPTVAAADGRYKPISYVPTWSEITGKPTTFPPSAHTHVAADITNFTQSARGSISAAAPITYNSTSGAIGWNGTTSNVPEGMNLYFSNARVQSFSDTRYTPLTRTLGVGTGMTGGGDLSVDRSIGLDWGYLDDRYLSGYKQRDAVRVATTANITLSGLQAIDGVTVAAGDRVLVKNQTAGAQNGIYIASSGAWSRSPDFDAVSVDEVAQGSQIFVSEGNVNNKTGWSLATGGNIILNTTPLTFIQYSGANSYSAGTGLTLTGNTFSAQTGSNLWNANKLQNIGIATTAPTTGQLLRYDGTNWSPWTSNYLTGELDLIAQSKTVSLSAGTGINITGSTQTIGNNPAFTITNIGSLSTTLANGTTANNNITLGAFGNTTSYSYNSIRNIAGTDYTATFGNTKGASMTSTDGSSTKVFLVAADQNAPQYSPDAGSNYYDVWHSNNHPAGSAFSPTLTGANVLSSLTTNSAGHVTGVTTRTLTASDIGAAPASGSANYIQNQTTSAQPGSGFWTAGVGVANRFASVGTVATTTGDLVLYEGTSAAGANQRWRIIRTGTEDSGNTGNDFNIQSLTNTGALWANPFSINRSTSIVTMAGGFRAANASGIFGTGTGTNNTSYLSFYESNGSTRVGYVGKGSTSNTELYLASDIGNINLTPSGGIVNLASAAPNLLNWATVGTGAPTFTTRSAGTKLALWPNTTTTSVDYGIGVETSHTWNSVPQNLAQYGFKWYGGTSLAARLGGNGQFEVGGQGRFGGWYTAGVNNWNIPATEIGYTSGHGTIAAIDRSTNTYSPLWLQGGTSTFVNTVLIDGTGVGINYTSPVDVPLLVNGNTLGGTVTRFEGRRAQFGNALEMYVGTGSFDLDARPWNTSLSAWSGVTDLRLNANTGGTVKLSNSLTASSGGVAVTGNATVSGNTSISGDLLVSGGISGTGASRAHKLNLYTGTPATSGNIAWSDGSGSQVSAITMNDDASINFTGSKVIVNPTLQTQAGIQIKEGGTNARMGVASFPSGTTSVVVNTIAVTANSRIFLTVQSTNAVAPISTPVISARTPGSNFTISWSKNASTDTGTVAWMIVEPY